MVDRLATKSSLICLEPRGEPAMRPVGIPCAAVVRRKMAGATRKAAGAGWIQGFAGVSAGGVDSILEREIQCAPSF